MMQQKNHGVTPNKRSDRTVCEGAWEEMMEHLEWRTPLSGVPYQITKINLSYQDGKHGKAWGIVDKEGREVVLCGYIKENPFYICSEAGSRDIGLPENQEFFAIKHRHNRTKRMRRWKIRSPLKEQIKMLV